MTPLVQKLSRSSSAPWKERSYLFRELFSFCFSPLIMSWRIDPKGLFGTSQTRIPLYFVYCLIKIIFETSHLFPSSKTSRISTITIQRDNKLSTANE